MQFFTPTQLPASTTVNIRNAQTWAILAVVPKEDAHLYISTLTAQGIDVTVELTNGQPFPSGQWSLDFPADYAIAAK